MAAAGPRSDAAADLPSRTRAARIVRRRDRRHGVWSVFRGGRGVQTLYCRTCEPTPVRVSVRDRRDARSDPCHFSRHPELRGAAVPRSAAAVDGAHAGARPVRPRRQADLRSTITSAATSSSSTRPSPGLSPMEHRSSSASSRSAVHRFPSRTTASTSTAPRSTAVHLRRPGNASDGRPIELGDRPGRAVRDG